MLDASAVYALTFLVFIAIVWYAVWPQVAQALDEYIMGVQHKIHEASRYREDALAFLNSCKRKHMEATIKAEKIIEQAHGRAQQMAVEFEQDLRAFEVQQRELAEERVHKLEIAVHQDIQDRLLKSAFDKVAQRLEEGAL
jgi:F0F1-type ATP synthase membrane subunit b/b'